jgi:serine/threonine protein kinase
MILAGRLASPDVRRFEIEAEAVANLDHPNIVLIYDVGQHEGQHYFTMKLIAGGSLTQAGGNQQFAIGRKRSGATPRGRRSRISPRSSTRHPPP